VVEEKPSKSEDKKEKEGNNHHLKEHIEFLK